MHNRLIMRFKDFIRPCRGITPNMIEFPQDVMSGGTRTSFQTTDLLSEDFRAYRFNVCIDTALSRGSRAESNPVSQIKIRTLYFYATNCAIFYFGIIPNCPTLYLVLFSY